MLNNEKYQTLQLLDSRVAGTQASGSTGRTKPHQQGQSIRYGQRAVASAIYSCLHELLTVSTGAACSLKNKQNPLGFYCIASKWSVTSNNIHHAAFVQQGTVPSLERFSRVYRRTKLHSKNTMVHKQITSWVPDATAKKRAATQWPLGQQNSERGNAVMGVLILSKNAMGVLCQFKLYSAMKLWSLTQTVMAMISQLDKRFS